MGASGAFRSASPSTATACWPTTAGTIPARPGRPNVFSAWSCRSSQPDRWCKGPRSTFADPRPLTVETGCRVVMRPSSSNGSAPAFGQCWKTLLRMLPTAAAAEHSMAAVATSGGQCPLWPRFRHSTSPLTHMPMAIAQATACASSVAGLSTGTAFNRSTSACSAARFPAR
ncbi:hypothetical protein GALL_397800 [mine drainage metagenome]|uniref:Uncharacterized protein n=1 Tax=mine drainage metagenome TaxID=410659 RepID=A0A1J5QRF4_9ZZZZ